MANVVAYPTLAVEMQLSELSALLDAMLFMHEVAGDGDRQRIMLFETSMLHVMRDKVQVAQSSLERLQHRAAA